MALTEAEELELLELEAQEVGDAAKPETAKITQTESAVRGGIQGLTLGTSDEAEAAAKSIGQTPIPMSPQADLLSKFKESYARKIPEVRQEYKTAEEANPWTYKGAQLAGNVPYAFAPGGMPVMAAAGAIQEVGESEKTGLGDLSEEAAKGATLGMLPGVVGDSLSLFKPVASRIKKEQAVKALGATKGMFGNTFETAGKKLESIGEAADRGVVTAFGGLSGMIDKVKNIRKSSTDTFDEVAKLLKQEGKGIDSENIAKTTMDNISDTYKTNKYKGEISDIENLIKAVKSPEELKALKNEYSSMGYNSRGLPIDTDFGGLYRRVAHSLEKGYTKEIDDVVKMSENADLLARYAKAKKDYAFTKDAEKALTNKLASQSTGKNMSPSEALMLTGGILAGDVFSPLNMIATTKLLNTYGNQLSSAAAKTLESAITKGEMNKEALSAIAELTALATAGGKD